MEICTSVAVSPLYHSRQCSLRLAMDELEQTQVNQHRSATAESLAHVSAMHSQRSVLHCGQCKTPVEP